MIPKTHLWLAAVVPAVLLAACGGESTPTGEAVLLKMQMPNGYSISQEVDLDYTMSMSVGPQDMEIPMHILMGMTYTAGDKHNKLTPLTIAYDRIALDMRVMGMEMAFDSNEPAYDETGRLYRRMFGAMMSVLIKMECGEDGSCRIVSTADEMMDALRDSLPDMSDAELQESTKNFNQSMGAYMATLPSKPVRPGDTWKSEINSDVSGTPMTFKNTYKLVEVKDGYAVIEVKSDIDLDETELSSGEGTAEAKGEQTATMKVNIETGWTEEGTIEQELEMRVRQQGMKVPVDMKGTITLRTLRAGTDSPSVSDTLRVVN